MPPRAAGAEADFEAAYGATTHNAYGMCAMRHMHDYGTTSEQLAWIKVAASHHAQYNPHAMLQGRRHRRGRAQLADDFRSAAPDGLLRRHRRRRRADRHHAGDRQEPEEAAGAADRPWRGDEGTARRQGSRSDLFGRRLVRPARLRRGRRHAEGYQIRLDLRQLHHHGADAARRPRLLQEGRGRQVRRRRQSDFRRRQAAVQHRWRRPLQQPSGQPRRHDQDHRSGAPVARRSASEGAGAELRSRRSPTAPAACSACATPPQPAFWSVRDG